MASAGVLRWRGPQPGVGRSLAVAWAGAGPWRGRGAAAAWAVGLRQHRRWVYGSIGGGVTARWDGACLALDERTTVVVREIRLYGDPVLRTPAEPVKEFGEVSRALAEDLLDTLDVPGRAGVAAPQIGVPARAFSYGVDGKRGVLFNPVLTKVEGEQLDDEGCLSVPGLWFPTRRAAYAAVEGFDADGEPVRLEGEGELARCFQHEVDHLDGIVYIHRLEPSTRRGAMRAIRRSAWFAA
jgi:peptide deformylase